MWVNIVKLLVNVLYTLHKLFSGGKVLGPSEFLSVGRAEQYKISLVWSY
jgi:hypothetical protein